MTRIILIRHGKTDWNREFRMQGGSSDIPLNKDGRQQARNMAFRLRERRIQAIFTSPLKRAIETTRIIARNHNTEIVVDKSLREIEAGELEGATSAELGRRFSDILTQDGVTYRVSGGESLTDLQQRSWGFIQQLSHRYPDCELVVVSHYFTILTIICSTLMLKLSNITRFRLSTGCINIINLSEKEPRLELLNDTSHLAQFP